MGAPREARYRWRWPGRSTRRGPALGLERKLPVLSHERLPETAVALALYQAEAGPLVQMARFHQHIVGPQGERPVASLARGVDAGLDQSGPQAVASSPGLDQQEPEPRDLLRRRHQKHAAGPQAVEGGDPAALRRIGPERGSTLRIRADPLWESDSPPQFTSRIGLTWLSWRTPSSTGRSRPTTSHWSPLDPGLIGGG
jgi:hypothetical protein